MHTSFKDTFEIVFRRALVYCRSSTLFGQEGLQFINTLDDTEIYLDLKFQFNLITIKGMAVIQFEFIKEVVERVENDTTQNYSIRFENCILPPSLPFGYYKTGDNDVAFGYLHTVSIRFDFHDATDSVQRHYLVMEAMSFDRLEYLRSRVKKILPLYTPHECDTVCLIGYEVDEDTDEGIYDTTLPISQYYKNGITFIFANIPHPFEVLL